METLYLVLGCCVVTIAIVHSVRGELKLFRKAEVQKQLQQIKRGKQWRAIWHVVTILLLGFGGILMRMGLPNMRLVCIQRLVFMTLLSAGVFVLLKARRK